MTWNCYIRTTRIDLFFPLSFAPVVLVMKVLLSQHALDKPFSGGLGSFKLYVLVASHVSQVVAVGGLAICPTQSKLNDPTFLDNLRLSNT
jgi:hypothetical protein